MASNTKLKKPVDNYGPESLDMTATLTLVNGSAPTVTEAQGITYTSRAGTGDYTLTMAPRGLKNVIPQLTVESSTRGVIAQVGAINLSTGTVQILVSLSTSAAASEVTGNKIHLFLRGRVVS